MFSSQNVILMLEFCGLEPDATGASLLIRVVINGQKMFVIFISSICSNVAVFLTHAAE